MRRKILSVTGKPQRERRTTANRQRRTMSSRMGSGIPLSCFVSPRLGCRQSPIDTIGSRSTRNPLGTSVRTSSLHCTDIRNVVKDAETRNQVKNVVGKRQGAAGSWLFIHGRDAVYHVTNESVGRIDDRHTADVRSDREQLITIGTSKGQHPLEGRAWQVIETKQRIPGVVFVLIMVRLPGPQVRIALCLICAPCGDLRVIEVVAIESASVKVSISARLAHHDT